MINRKKLTAVTLSLSLIIALGGCSNANLNVKPSESDSSEIIPASETEPDDYFKDTDDSDGSSTVALKDPEIVWYQVYNPNGFETFTAELHNPNSVPIDASFDVIFYDAEGSELARLDYFYANSVSPTHNDIVWSNDSIPNHEKVDHCEFEFTYTGETYYPPVDGTYEFTGNEGNHSCYKFTFDEPIYDAYAFFVLYNDNNGNGRPDGGEVDCCPLWPLDMIDDVTGTAYFETDVWGDNYNAVAVYYNATKAQ